MIRFILMLLTLGAISPTRLSAAADAKAVETKPHAALDFEMAKLGKKKKINLAKEYADKVVLLVNVASRCGLTPQYDALQELHEKYKDKGLAVVGVPCNQFGGQEPGSALEITTFCKKNYGVTFDLLEKSNVKSSKPGQCALYQNLTSKKTNPNFAGDIKWNFTKFLLGPEGQVIARFGPRVKPGSKEVVSAIEQAIADQRGGSSSSGASSEGS